MAISSIVPPHQRNLARLARAKTMIKKGQYGNARTLLLTIDHPVAVQWLRHLDEHLLGNPFARTGRKWFRAVVRVALVLLLLALLAVAKHQYDSSEETRQRISGYYGFTAITLEWISD